MLQSLMIILKSFSVYRKHSHKKFGVLKKLKLDGMKALVTGASQGLGYATGRGLVLEGCNAAINSRNPAKLNAAAEILTGEGKSKARNDVAI